MKNITPPEQLINQQQIEIGKFITELRSMRHITQKELADMLGTSQSAIARMEKGEQNFSTEMLLKVSAVLGNNIISLSRGTVSYQVDGGRKLSGTISTNTAKNSAVALLFTSLLNKNTTTLKNVPHIEEVHRIIEVLTSIGVSVKWQENDLEITPPSVFDINAINTESAVRTRSAILLLGALSNSLTQYNIPYPGGCDLGIRTLAPHIDALEALGIHVETTDDNYEVYCGDRKSAEIVMYESGDVATENIILAAATIPGKTTIHMASANYMVQEVCLLLKEFGVVIEGIGTTTLVIHGKEDINVPVSYTLAEDPIESMLFITAAIMTNSSITIERCPIDFLRLELLKLKKMGFKYKVLKSYCSGNEHTKLVDIQTYPSKLTALPEKLYGRPYPGINIDNLPFFAPIATQAEGQTLIHDWVYENRAIYYAELKKLGADITVADPHRAYVGGKSKLQSAEIICPPALRPAAAILVTMLAAKGTSILRNVYTINRGYEEIFPRLNKLGARIEVLHSLL